MTEQEWLASNNPDAMMQWIAPGKVSVRKLRLIACACVRSAWHLLEDAHARRAVEEAERFADGTTGKGLLAAASIQFSTRGYGNELDMLRSAVFSCCQHCPHFAPQTLWRVRRGVWESKPWQGEDAREASKQADIIREIVGNPHQPWSALRTPDGRLIVTSLEDQTRHRTLAEPWLAWNDGTVLRLAERAYQKRDWSALPIIADALEDAGCADAVILEHLRSSGPHCLGCWALDIILGKS